MRLNNERFLPLITIIAAHLRYFCWTTEGCREALSNEYWKIVARYEYWKTVARYEYWKLSSEISAPILR